MSSPDALSGRERWLRTRAQPPVVDPERVDLDVSELVVLDTGEVAVEVLGARDPDEEGFAATALVAVILSRPRRSSSAPVVPPTSRLSVESAYDDV